MFFPSGSRARKVPSASHFEMRRAGFPRPFSCAEAAGAMKDAEIEDFFEGFKQPTYRGSPKPKV